MVSEQWNGSSSAPPESGNSSSPAATVAATVVEALVSTANVGGHEPIRAKTWDEACILLKAGIWPITDDYQAPVSFLTDRKSVV